MNCGKPSHIRKWFGPCVLSYGHGGSCEHPPLEALHESDGRCSKCGNDREAWDRAVAEIARLTAERDRAVAELAAAREVPADVEAAIGKATNAATAAGRIYETSGTSDCIAAAEEVAHWSRALKAAIARAIAAARSSPPATVGGLLATTPVVDIIATQPVVEVRQGPWWFQMRADGMMRSWLDGDGGWASWGSSWHARVSTAPAGRLVPLHLADLDPATRGPLPGGEG